MEDLIRKARPRKGAKYVCMEGADRLVREICKPSFKTHNEVAFLADGVYTDSQMDFMVHR